MQTVKTCLLKKHILPLVMLAGIAMTAQSLHAALTCSWTSPPSTLNFGTYSVFGGSTATSSTPFTITCNPNTDGKVIFSRGANAPTLDPRKLKSGTTFVDYNIYLDAAGTQIWGDGTGGTSYEAYGDTTKDKVFNDVVYGIAPSLQDLAPGVYTDSLVATLSWVTKTGSSGSQPPLNVTVMMTVLPECRVDTFAMNFGAYNPLNTTGLVNSTTLKVYCTKTTSASVVLNNGSNASGAQRRMVFGGTSFLSYGATLGSSSGTSTSVYTPIAGGFVTNGTVTAQQDVPVGAYTDTLVATVNY